MCQYLAAYRKYWPEFVMINGRTGAYSGSHTHTSPGSALPLVLHRPVVGETFGVAIAMLGDLCAQRIGVAVGGGADLDGEFVA